MQIDSQALIVILGMAVVTYATRVGGLWLMQRVTFSKRTTVWLQYIPGTVLVSIVAPTVFTSGPAEALAALVTVLVAVKTRSSLLAMVAGVIAVWGLRTLV